MKKDYRLTPAAKVDLLTIGRFTYKTFGIEKRNIYLKKLDESFSLLATNHHLGLKRDEIREGYRSFPVASHIIFYRVGQDGIEILGIPHKNMDIENMNHPAAATRHQLDREK